MGEYMWWFSVFCICSTAGISGLPICVRCAFNYATVSSCSLVLLALLLVILDGVMCVSVSEWVLLLLLFAIRSSIQKRLLGYCTFMFLFLGFSLLRSLLLPLFSDLFAIIIIIILIFCYNASSLIGWCARAKGYRHRLPQLLEELWFRLEDQHLIGTALRAVLVIGALVLVIGCERCGIINHGLCLDIEHEIRMCARIYVAISPDSTISLPLI